MRQKYDNISVLQKIAPNHLLAILIFGMPEIF